MQKFFRQNQRVVLLCFGIILISSCLKYEDGPIISTRSRLNRMSNIWMTDEITIAGEDSTIRYADYTWRFKKDFSFDFFGTRDSLAWSRSGEWKFIDNKKSIELVNLASDSTYTFRITKLMQNHLWLMQTDSLTGIEKVFKLKKKKL